MTNCYLLESKGELVLIDPGAEPERILEEIKKTGAKALYIVNTHYHPDHTLGNEYIRKNTGAKLLIHEAEKNFIKFEPDRFIKDGDEIKFGGETLKVISAPGHSAGSICLFGDSALFTGDLLFVDGYGRTDLPGGSEKEIKNSLEKISGIIKPGMTIYPGHGEIFTTEKDNGK